MDKCSKDNLERRINTLEIETGALAVSLVKDIAAMEKQTVLRFEAAEKLVTAAFASSEKAIQKAEDAQLSYNATHNDLSRKMDSQYNIMAPRTETASMFKGVEEKIEGLKKDHEKDLDAIREDIKSLRESRAGTSGAWSLLLAAVGIVSLLAAILRHR